MKHMDRRQFLKLSGGCAAAGALVGITGMLVPKPSQAATINLNFLITDAVKDMVTHNAINKAQCYFWLFKEANFPAEIPGPHIFATEGDTINVSVTNGLDENHAFFIPGVVNSGPITPGSTASFSFTAPAGGTYMYYDNLNEPVNRVMGLHGCMVVMPAAAVAGHKFTPYSTPTTAVQQLFDDFGTAAHWPGLSWQDGDLATDTPPFRQYVWQISEASSRLFADVGNYTPGQDFPAADFIKSFHNARYRTDGLNCKPEFFTLAGQSGHFSHNNPYICPMNRVGEPVVIRILNAGLNTHSLHIHANHIYVTGINGTVQDNPLWLDVFTIHPLNRVEYTLPFMRPPDVPNSRGIGLPDTPLMSLANPGIPGSTPHPVWPPMEEINTFLPAQGTVTAAGVPIDVQLSPLCFPMHDHSEASQTAQGGNYNCGLISGINFTGDRNIAAPAVTTFPNAPSQHGPNTTGPAAGPDVTM